MTVSLQSAGAAFAGEELVFSWVPGSGVGSTRLPLGGGLVLMITPGENSPVVAGLVTNIIAGKDGEALEAVGCDLVAFPAVGGFGAIIAAGTDVALSLGTDFGAFVGGWVDGATMALGTGNDSFWFFTCVV